MEAPEAAIFHGSESGSGKHEMNGSGSGSSKKLLEAEAEAIENSPLPHHCLQLDFLSEFSIVIAIM